MLSVAFDTLKLARKYENAGFPPKQAQDMAAAQAEAFTEWQGNLDLATKADLERLRVDIQRLEAATKTDIERLDTSLKAEIKRLEERIETRIADKAAETIKWVVGMSIAQASLVIALLKLHG